MDIEEYSKNLYKIETYYWWFRAKRKFLIKILEKLKPHFKNYEKLLDIGCGAGENMKQIQKIMQVVGIDMSIGAVKFCKKRGLYRLINGEAECLPFLNESFKIITAMDILEHVDDDWKVLNEISRVCKKDGVLILHVPAFKFLWSDHDIAVNHRRRYSIKDLNQKLKKSSFIIEKINYRVITLFPFGIIHRLFLKIRRAFNKNHEVTIHRPKVGKLINRFLEFLIFLEDIFVNYIRFPFGMSIICIARKRSNL